MRRFDEKNWVLEVWRTNRRKNKFGGPTPDGWVILGYYGKLRDLAAAALNRSIIVPDGTLAEQIPALIQAVKEAEARLTEMLTNPKSDRAGELTT